MRNKKFMLIAILILAVGFASVSTVFYITGNLAIATSDDFDVYFSGAILDGDDRSNELIKDKKHIVYKTKELKKVNDESVLVYEVTNGSTQYDADVVITCTPNSTDYYEVITTPNALSVEAGHVETGIVTVKQKKYSTEIIEEEFECELVANATERTSTGTSVEVSEDYSVSGYLVDDLGNPLANKNLVVYSNTPHYVKTDLYGYFYADGLEKGMHEIYLVNGDVTNKTKEEVKEVALTEAYVSTTNTKDIVFKNNYKIVETDTKQVNNKIYNIELDYGYDSKIENREVTENHFYNLPTPIREGFSFLGWYLNDKLITNEVIVKENNAHTLIAKWYRIDAPVISGGNTTWSTDLLTVNLAEEGYASDGLKHYEYYISENNTVPTESTIATGTTSGSYTFTQYGHYYIWYRTVSIKNEKSVWSNVQEFKMDNTKFGYSSYEIKNLNSTGFDVYVYNVVGPGGITKVQFPTWTDYNGQDDMVRDWQTNSKTAGTNLGNGTWMYHVNIADHNNEGGRYIVHIYAFNPDNKNSSAFITLTQEVKVSGYVGSIYPGGATYTGNLNVDLSPSNVYNNFTYEFVVTPSRSITMTGLGKMAPYSTGTFNYITNEIHGGNGVNAGFGVSVGTNGVIGIAHGDAYYYVLLYYSANLSGKHYYKVTVKNNIPYLYIDGKLVSTGIKPVGSKTTLFTNGVVGTGSYGKFYGTVDSVVFYNTAR